jgi:HK97 family phage major capsid protein
VSEDAKVTPEAKQLVEELKSTWTADFKELHSKLEAEEKARGEASAETKQAFERADARLDEIEVRFQKAIEAGERKDTKERSSEAKAFNAWLTKGERSLSVDESKVLVLSDDTQAGFLAPDDVRHELLKGVVEYSVLRPIIRVIPTVRSSVKIPKRTGTFAAVWVGETASRSETTGLTYGLVEVPTHELYALVDIGNQMLEDSAYDLEAELGMEFSEQFGKAESTAIVAGTGVGQPLGFTDAGSGVSTVATATNDTFVANDVIELYFTPKTVYARNGTWLMNRGILKAVRKFQDSVGNYLWQPGLAGVAPATIMDRPYIETPELASSVADAALIAAFGDFSKGYVVADRVQLSIQRDPYTQNTAGATRFIARKRVGGQPAVTEAIKILKVA